MTDLLSPITNSCIERNHLAAVFDFGGVLLDWNFYYLFREFFNDDAAVERFLEEVQFREYNYQKDQGRPYAEICEELCQRFPRYEAPLRAFETRWIEIIRRPIQPVVEILAKLKENGIALYGLSNFSPGDFELMRRKYEFFSWFDVVLLSGEVKIAKPDARIFELLLTRTGREARDCLLIDDTAENVETAEKLGFKTILYKNPEQLRDELMLNGVWL